MKIKQYIYADDITVVCTGQSIDLLKDKMQIFLNDFVLWTEKWGLKVNPNKTVIQVYTRKRIEICVIRLRGCVIENKKNHNFWE